MSSDRSRLKLIAIADNAVLAGRDYLDACIAAEMGGATSLQIRMKTATTAELLYTAERVVRSLSIPVFVNDRTDAAIIAGVAGVHLGADDLPISRARNLPGGRQLCFGMSVGDLTEAKTAVGEKADYWGCGPVYCTPNKSDAGNAIGISGLKELIGSAGETPVVGIGGIDISNCAGVIEAGAVGVAVVGAIFASDDIEKAARAIRDATDAALVARINAAAGPRWRAIP